MKPLMMLKNAALCMMIATTAAMMFATDAFAASGGGFTRSDWDLIMRWINFIILAALIVKYLRKPLMDFLHSQKDEVAQRINRYEDQKKNLEADLLESRHMLEASEERLKSVESRIIAEGERRKKAAIESAQAESRIMIKTAQHKIEGQLRETYIKLKAEIIDSAIQIATAKMPALLTAEDHDRLIHQWIEASRG